MTTHSLVVKVISENGLKCFTLHGLGASSPVSEVSRLVGQKLSTSSKKCSQSHGNSGVLRVTCMRDHSGVRLSPHATIDCQRSQDLYAEVDTCDFDESDERLTDEGTSSRAEETRKGVTVKNVKAMDCDVSRSAGKKKKQSASPSKSKKQKTNGEGSKSSTDAGRTAEGKLKRKLPGCCLSDGEEEQESRCASCGGIRSNPPSVRLQLTHRMGSGQPPATVNLRLQQRPCKACSGKDGDGSISTEPGQDSASPLPDPGKGTPKVKKRKAVTRTDGHPDARGVHSEGHHPSSSQQGVITLADHSDQVLSSSQTIKDRTKSPKQTGAKTRKEPKNQAAATGETPGTIGLKDKSSPSSSPRKKKKAKERSNKKEAAEEPSNKISDHPARKSELSSKPCSAKERSNKTEAAEEPLNKTSDQPAKKSELSLKPCSAKSEHLHKKACITPTMTENGGSAGKLSNVKSKYFSATEVMKNLAASVNGSHREPKKEGTKAGSTMHSTSKGVRPADTDTTPVVTVDSTSLTWALLGQSQRHKTPEQTGGRHPQSRDILSGSIEEDTSGLSKPSQAQEVTSCADASFEWNPDSKEYTDLDSVPVIISDSLDGFKDDCSLSDDSDPVIVRIGKNELKHADLATLEEGEWLNDCVINAYFHLLSKKSPLNIFTHSSFFFFSLYERGYEGVKRWTKNVDLFEQDLFFVPIHNKSHWSLVVVHIKEGVMEYYNSSTLLHGYPRSMTHIQTYLQAEAVHRGKDAFAKVPWEMYILHQIPRQQNMDDCGLFICQYAKKLSFQQKVAFDCRKTSNLRQQMLRELLAGDVEFP